jgi:hypothetical protein
VECFLYWRIVLTQFNKVARDTGRESDKEGEKERLRRGAYCGETGWNDDTKVVNA